MDRAAPPPPPKRRRIGRCSICGQEGHKRTNQSFHPSVAVQTPSSLHTQSNVVQSLPEMPLSSETPTTQTQPLPPELSHALLPSSGTISHTESDSESETEEDITPNSILSSSQTELLFDSLVGSEVQVELEDDIGEVDDVEYDSEVEEEYEVMAESSSFPSSSTSSSSAFSSSSSSSSTSSNETSSSTSSSTSSPGVLHGDIQWFYRDNISIPPLPETETPYTQAKCDSGIRTNANGKLSAEFERKYNYSTSRRHIPPIIVLIKAVGLLSKSFINRVVDSTNFYASHGGKGGKELLTCPMTTVRN